MVPCRIASGVVRRADVEPIVPEGRILIGNLPADLNSARSPERSRAGTERRFDGDWNKGTGLGRRQAKDTGQIPRRAVLHRRRDAALDTAPNTTQNIVSTRLPSHRLVATIARIRRARAGTDVAAPASGALALVPVRPLRW